jgi:hypothetical protein
VDVGGTGPDPGGSGNRFVFLRGTLTVYQTNWVSKGEPAVGGGLSGAVGEECGTNSSRVSKPKLPNELVPFRRPTSAKRTGRHRGLGRCGTTSPA